MCPLTCNSCRLRVTWSREHCHGPPASGPVVMFSDESRFSLPVDSRRLSCRRQEIRCHQREHRLNDTAWWQDGSFGRGIIPGSPD
ncbi:hypothetical protein AVEN_254238-1 [Araneus ventricosus]|uniref:Uncharacterized protein n=1 Tax=Araneus ventricosus TaxID=182803 RepID=A0A4Y2S891_ARAVE|nr:hypothetical protein AVEN_254238-1 [Araneus ventricosus]